MVFLGLSAILIEILYKFAYNKFSIMKLIVYFILLFFAASISAQEVQIAALANISKLPVNATHRIFQGSDGYLWYGTVDGLCRDDGYNIKVFRSDINTPRLIADNLIESIGEDTLHRIWIGTCKGAYILDKKDYSIHELDTALRTSRIINIYRTTDGDMWIARHGWLSRYNMKLEAVRHYPTNNQWGQTTVAGFAEDKNNRIYICFSGGNYFKYNPENDCFDTLHVEGASFFPVMLIPDRDSNYFWQGTWNDGIAKFYPETNRVEYCTEHKFSVVGMAQDINSGHIWATTETGLICYRITDSGKLAADVFAKGCLPDGHMLVEVHRGNDALYVSAFDCPAMVIHSGKSSAHCIDLDDLRDKTGITPAVMSLSTQDDKLFWLMLERCGLCLYNIETGNLKIWNYQPELRNLGLHNGREIIPSKHHNGIWTTPDFCRQIYALTNNSMEIKVLDNYNFDSLTPLSNTITRLFETGDKLLIGMTSGLFVYDIATRRMESHPLKAGYVTDICQDDHDNIFVATRDSGIICFDNHITQKTRMPFDNNFTCITTSPDGTLWLGSADGGLYSISPDSNVCNAHHDQLSLNGDQINKVYADDFGHIWVMQNYQVIEYNPHNGSFRTYSARDGSMPINRLIPTALCVGVSGTIYFGGIPGILATKPSNTLERQSKNVAVTITCVNTNGKDIFLGGDDNSKKLAIEISPDDINIEIYFSTLNHADAKKIRYACILEGYYKDWQYIEPTKNSLSISKLPKGKYTLKVKATDENGLWSNNITTMTIIRRPAWFETWWAYLVYIAVAISLILVAFHKQLRRVERKNDEQWADSREMMRMRNYIIADVPISEPEYIQLDKILIEKATKSVEENLSEPDFDVAALAENMNMSRSTLTRKLKAITGKTPLEFINDIKMRHAALLLGDKDRSVSDIATALGYGNRKYFTQCFKETYNMTPTEYRTANFSKSNSNQGENEV
mgnify:FL=1